MVTNVSHHPMRILILAALILGNVRVAAAEYQVWNEWHNSLAPAAGSGTELTLASNGETDYRIVIPATATTQDTKAADDLQYWLQQITGVQLAIVNEGTPLQGDSPISIGRTTLLQQSGLPAASVDLGDEGYGIATQGSTLFLWGGQTRAAINAVYALLEEDLGCRWYTTDHNRIPSQPVLTFTPVDRTYVPPLKLRDPFYHVAFNEYWSLRNRTNAPWAPVREGWGGRIDYDGLFVHTFDTLVPPSQYFDTHPEYFMMDAEGNRNKAALCTTNPDVCQLVTSKVQQILNANPYTEIVSVSENDNKSYCLCPTCKALDDPEGSSMASLLYLVNYVAEAIEQNHPNVLVSTLAYFNTIGVPNTVRPRDNVAIRLCNALDCAWEQPFVPSQQTDFGPILESWSAAHDQISIWTYTVNFYHYLAPMPNMEVIAEDIQYMVTNNAVGIMTQGAYQSAGERDWMRAWVIAKLLWDPSRDWFELMQDFIWGHYGQAASAIAEHNELLRQQGELYADQIRRPPNGIRYPMTIAFLTKDFLDTASAIFNQAEILAENDDVLHRVQRERLPIMYVKLDRGPEFTGIEYGDVLDRFDTIAHREGATYLRERSSPNLDEKLQEWQSNWEDYLENLWAESPVAIDMGAVDNEQWLRRITVDDGDTVPVNVSGRDARRNQDPNSDHYFYFDMDDHLIYQGNRPELYITLDYYDTGSGSLTLQYDSDAGSGPPAIYKDGGSITLTDTNTWRQHVYVISDAYFGNRQDGNADFRIFGGVGSTFYLDIVQISDVHRIPEIEIDVTSVDHRIIIGTYLPSDLFTVTNIGDGILTYTITQNASWLNVSPDSGMSTGEPDPINITYDTASLALGDHSTVIQVESTHAAQSPQAITVNLHIFTPGDIDYDGDVDLEDFGRFQACMTGPGWFQIPEGCEGANFDADSNIDENDFWLFCDCISGANIPVDPNCAE